LKYILACAEWWANITLFYKIERALSKRDEMCVTYTAHSSPWQLDDWIGWKSLLLIPRGHEWKMIV
jgi:hypothetical protein